jgi:uncharacterized membrane protein YidH (DUF202 family)
VTCLGWDILSLVNGNPELHFSAIRFLMGIFFIAVLYTIIRMQAVSTYHVKHIVALAGSVFLMFRFCSMLFLVSGWELQIYNDPIIHFLYPPVEHVFASLSLACFMWYSVESSPWWIWIRRKAKYIFTFLILFYVYTIIYWKQFFITQLPNYANAFKECPVDYQFHIIASVICSVGLVAAVRGLAKYLSVFWFFQLGLHVSSAVAYFIVSTTAATTEPSWLSTVFNIIEVWTIPLLILHFVSRYVRKMTRCNACQREVTSFT